MSSISDIKKTIDDRRAEFSALLPASMSFETFREVLITAVAQTPDLQGCDLGSIILAARNCARDGLLPDGREAIITPVNKNTARKGQPDNWIKVANYTPMSAGIRKRAFETGLIKVFTALIVHANDVFEYDPASGQAPRHEADWFGDRGEPVGVYAVAVMNDGTVITEIVPKADLDMIQSKSKSAKGPAWMEFRGEMWRKAAMKRLSKYLPIKLSIDIGNDEFDFNDAPQPQAPRIAGKPRALQAILPPPPPEEDVSQDVHEIEYNQDTGEGDTL